MYDNILEGQYLIKLLASAINNTPVVAPPKDLDWVKLYRLASFHSVANTAYYSLLHFPDQTTIPETIYNKFSTTAKKFSAQEALQHFEVRQILLQFEQSQIFCVPLSGHVMKSLYPRPDMRYMSNVELLIKEEDKSIIHSIMTSLGYNLIRSTDFNYSYFKSPNISIELSTSLMPKNNELYDYFNGIVQNLSPKKGFNYIHAMDKEDFYIFSLTWLAQHYAAGGAGIRSILDIWVFLSHYSPILNREFVAMELNKLNLGLFSFYIEELAWIWFGGGDSFSNKGLYQEMESYIFSCSVGGDVSQQVAQEPTKQAKTSHVKQVAEEPKMDDAERRRLFPNLDAMSMRYPILKNMPFMLPIFWLIRIACSLLSRNLHLPPVSEEERKEEKKDYSK